MTDRKGDRNNHRNERWQRQQRKSDERVTGSWQLTFRMCDDRYIYLAPYLIFCWFHQKYLRKQLIDLWSTYQNIQHL